MVFATIRHIVVATLAVLAVVAVFGFVLWTYTPEYKGKEGVVAIPYLAYCYKKIHDQENYLKYLRKAVSADREITEFLFAEDYPSIQPEEYYLYAFKNAYGRFPESWE